MTDPIDQHVVREPDIRPPAVPREPAIRPSDARRRRGRQRRAGWIVALLVLAGAGLGWWLQPWHGLLQRPARHAAALPQPVREAGAISSDFPVTLTELGTVTPVYTVTVISQIAGYLAEVEFQEGQIVRKGQEIALVDPRPYQAMLEQAEGQFAADEASLGQSRMDLARYDRLARSDSIARQTFEDQVFVVKQYEGKVKVDQAAIDTAKLDLVYCHITAPVGGRIGLRLVDPGNFVQSNSTTGIAVITQIQPITVIFSLPEDDVPDVLAEFNRHGRLAVAAYDRSDSRHLADGTVYAIDSQINTTTGMVNLRATFENAHEELFPNQFVNARLLVRTLARAVTVPRGAVLDGAAGAYVYVVNPDDTVSVRPVTPGPRDQEREVIAAGLKPGERVVTDGADRLREGTRVSIVPPPDANAAH